MQRNQEDDTTTDHLLAPPLPTTLRFNTGTQQNTVVRRKPLLSRTSPPPEDNWIEITEWQTPQHPLQSADDTDNPYVDIPRYWKPFWLKWTTLTVLFLLFTALWIALLVLWRYSVDNDGLKLTLTKNHYAWTYGPTAILVVVVSLWRQVDYYCKLVMPWYQMQMASLPASKSISLDYLWPIQIWSLAAAIRARHSAIVASIVGFILLKVVVVVSTGLLVLSPTTLSKIIPITSMATFGNGTLWDNVNVSIPDAKPIYAVSTIPVNQSQTNHAAMMDTMAYFNLPSAPLFAYVGTFKGVPTPGSGIIIDNVTLQSFDYPSTNENTTSISTQAHAFVPNVTCEEAEILHFQQRDDRVIVYDVSSQTCSAQYKAQNGSPDAIYNQSLAVETDCYAWDAKNPCPEFALYYDWRRVDCLTNNDPDADASGAPNASTLAGLYPSDYAYAMIQMNITNEQPTNYTGTWSDPIHTLTSSSVVICRVKYNLMQAQINYDPSTDQTSIMSMDQNDTLGHISGLTDLQLSELILSFNGGQSDVLAAIGQYEDFFDLLALTMHTDDKLDLFDVGTLFAAATDFYITISNILIDQMCMVPDQSQTPSTHIYVEDRLQIGISSLVVMAAFLGLLSLLSVYILFFMRKLALPQDIQSNASQAAILSRNSALRDLLQRKGHLNCESIADSLNGFHFASKCQDEYEIEVTSPTIPRESNSTMPAKHENWLPYSGRRHALWLTTLLPVLAIIVLEVLYQYSANHQGLLTVSGGSAAAVYATKYASMSAVLAVATLVNSLDFAVLALTPFVILRDRAVPASQGLLLELLGSSPPVSLFRAFKSRQVGALCSGVAALIGSTLTIVASGLWTVESSFSGQVPINGSVASLWTTAWKNSSVSDNGAVNLLNLNQHNASGVPPYVWQNIVLPNMAQLSTSSSDTNYTFKVDALRPQLDCEAIPATSRSVNITQKASEESIGYNDTVIEITTHLPLSPGCLVAGNETSIVHVIDFDNQYSSGAFYGWTTRLNIAWNGTYYDAAVYTDQSIYSSATQPDNPAGCPSTVVMFGRFGMTLPDPDDYAILLCSQKLQQVTTDVTFVGDPGNFQLSTQSPPIPDEKSAIYLTNGTAGIDSFEYQFRPQFDKLTWLPYVDGYQIDHFFDFLLKGRNRTTIDELIPENRTVNTTVLIDAVNRVYQDYMVLAAQLNLKIPTTENNTQTEVQGTMTSTLKRLTVNETSKIILQILLGVMTILSISAYLLVDLRDTLPGPPTTISTIMALFADSELCAPKSGIIVPGATRMTNKELEKMFQGYLFSLGWWHRSTERMDTGSEVVVSEEDEARKGSNVVTTADGADRWFGIDVGTADTTGFRRSGGGGDGVERRRWMKRIWRKK